MISTEVALCDLRTRALENAAACDIASKRAVDSMDKLTLHMLRELWKALALERKQTETQAAAEFRNLLDIQQDVTGNLRPALH